MACTGIEFELVTGCGTHLARPWRGMSFEISKELRFHPVALHKPGGKAAPAPSYLQCLLENLLI